MDFQRLSLFGHSVNSATGARLRRPSRSVGLGLAQVFFEIGVGPREALSTLSLIAPEFGLPARSKCRALVLRIAAWLLATAPIVDKHGRYLILVELNCGLQGTPTATSDPVGGGRRPKPPT